MSGTCANCEHSKEPPCAECEHCFVVGGGVYGSKFKRKCPLPRIGSKEWGWMFDQQIEQWISPKSVYAVGKYREYYYVVHDPDVPFDGWDSVSTAKRIAELLTRLDWKREHGGKK